MKLNELTDQAHKFLKKSFDQLERNEVFLEQHWQIDHLCYRTSTLEKYQVVKKQFEQFAKLLIESEVNGRLISTFKLPSPIVFNDWEIDLIEIPAPKLGKITIDGFEHFEIVCDLTFDEIKSRYSQCRFDESGLSKDLNQELELIFDGFAIKFHHLSLESVVNLEANTSVLSVLKETKVLKLLKPFNPLIAGTFPLQVDIPGSDLDILISGDLLAAKDILRENFKDFLDFKSDELIVDDEPTLLVSFKCQQLAIEIFCQKIPTVRQKGYLHILVEERLLKIGGPNFTKKITDAKSVGLKTEPAFVKVIGLQGDPYQELLKLQRLSNKELKAILDWPVSCPT